MSLDPQAEVFYGHPIAHDTLPEGISALSEKHGVSHVQWLVSAFLLEANQHNADEGYDPIYELGEKTGLLVVEDGEANMYLTLKASRYDQYGVGSMAIPLRLPFWPDLKFLADNAERLGSATKPSWYLTASLS